MDLPEPDPDAERRGAVRRSPCPRCTGLPLAPSYPYLLGQYLGDGHIAVGRRGVQALSIFCSDAWPGVARAVEAAMRAALGTSVCRAPKQGCTQLKSYSCHWICLLPQHGPGKKHERRIALEAWQQQIVDRQPADFLRGLFHSDGCRVINWTVRTVAGSTKRYTVAGSTKRYQYPRWFFANESPDILDLCSASLDRLQVAHRRPRRNVISVARHADVAVMDAMIDPKS